jgi:hypothetical protein
MAFFINPLNAELNPICNLLALLGAHHILHVSRIRVKMFYRALGLVIVLEGGLFWMMFCSCWYLCCRLLEFSLLNMNLTR